MTELATPAPVSLDDAVFNLGVALTRLPTGPLAELRRMIPGEGVATFWRLFFGLKLDAQFGRDNDWEWVVHALALLTPTGNDPEKRSCHESSIALGKALFDADVSEPRIAAVLNATLAQRRIALIRLVRLLADSRAKFDTRELARLLLFDHPDPADARNPLRRLARSYYAADAAQQRGNSDD